MSVTDFRYSLFFDFHTETNVSDFASGFSARKFIARVKSLGVDFITCHARCNRGNAYYRTKYGIPHPGMKADIIREIGEEAHRNGIRLTAYINVLMSEAEQFAHPEWGNVPMFPDRRGHDSPFYYQMCFNSPGYIEQLENMALELAEEYPVDGFFFDGLIPTDCVCPVCVGMMRSVGLDPKDEKQVREFSSRSATRLAKRLHEAIVRIKPDSYFFFNGRPYEDMAECNSHLEAECLPTADWGYECLPVMAHYLPAMAGGKQILNMTGRFNDWGDFGGLRTKEGLEYDMFYGMAHGMRPDIADHMHPGYDWPAPVAERIHQVYDEVRKYDKWTIGAWNKTEIAVVGAKSLGETFPFSVSVQAAVRLLTELKVQFDVVTTFVEWDRYRLLIFPDDVVFTPEIADRVRSHLEKGGRILATGTSGLAPGQDNFALDELWPAVYDGPYPYDQMFYFPEGRFSGGLPEMPMALYADGFETKAADGAAVEMRCVKPDIRRGWDGLRPNSYSAPMGMDTVPFLLEKNGIVYIAAELFKGYASKAPRQHRDLVQNILEQLCPEPQLRTDGLPSFARAFLQFREDGALVHLLAYCPERRGGADAVEDRIVVNNAVVALRTDGGGFSRVFSAGDGTELPFEIAEGYCRVKLPSFAGYALLVFEK